MSEKKKKIYITLFLVFVGLIIVAEQIAEQSNRKYITFSKDDKIPYGAKVLYELLPVYFPNSRITKNKQTFFLSLEQAPPETNIICLDYYFYLDKVETDKILSFVESGNNVFIAAAEFDGKFSDTLHFTVYSNFFDDLLDEKDSLKLNFVSPTLRTESGYIYARDRIASSYFSQIDTALTTILGITEHGDANFIKITYGNGHFFISTQPFIFSNFNIIVKSSRTIANDTTLNNAEYVAKALSYLPDTKNLIWDEYYKPGRTITSDSSLRYIMSSPSLKAALYTLITGLLLFTLFEAKRKQRAIPIIIPHPNRSIEFAETVGRLYFNRKNHTDLADKKITYLLEFLRSHYYIHIKNLYDIDWTRLIQKTGCSEITARKLFSLIRTIKGQHLTQENLIKFNEIIEDFYSECK